MFAQTEYPNESRSKLMRVISFGGEVIHSDIVRDPSRWHEIDLNAWHGRNSKEIRWPELFSCAQALRSKFKRVGVIGYCYGGWSSFRLGSSSHNPRLVDCISAAHPTCKSP